MANKEYQKPCKVREVMTLIPSTAPQNFTNSWVTLGSVINTIQGNVHYDTLAIFFKYDLNNTVDAQMRFGLRHTVGGDNYFVPIYRSISDQVKIGPEIYEIDVDADTNYVERISIAGAVQVDIQIYAAVPGATPGQIDEAVIVFETRM